MSEYGMQATGFIPKPFDVIQAELRAEYKNIYGDDLDVSDYSMAGQEINLHAKKLADIWEGMQAVHAQMNPDSAVGVSLEGACALIGITIPSPAKSTAREVFYGDDGTVVAAGKILEQEATGKFYTVDAEIEITELQAVDVTVEIPNEPETDTTYSIIINTSTFEFTDTGSLTKQEILHELYLLIQAGSEPVSVLEGDEDIRIVADDLNISFSINLSLALQYKELGSAGNITCTEYGVIPVPVNSVQSIVTPIVGLERVNNIIAGITGTRQMTDEEIRVYRRENLQANANATDEALQAALTQIANVSFARVISNRGLTTDSGGRPAKSFEAIVRGGLDASIGNTIWLKQPSGIESYGNASVVVKDSLNIDRTIYFSRPVPVYVWLRCQIPSSGEESGNASQLIKEAIYAWSQLTANNQIGLQIVFEKLYSPIYSVAGIYETTTLEIGISDNPATEPVSWVSANIALTERQVAEWAINRMNVTLV